MVTYCTMECCFTEIYVLWVLKKMLSRSFNSVTQMYVCRLQQKLWKVKILLLGLKESGGAQWYTCTVQQYGGDCTLLYKEVAIMTYSLVEFAVPLDLLMVYTQ